MLDGDKTESVFWGEKWQLLMLHLDYQTVNQDIIGIMKKA